jgi:hypothetical protein
VTVQQTVEASGTGGLVPFAIGRICKAEGKRIQYRNQESIDFLDEIGKTGATASCRHS